MHTLLLCEMFLQKQLLSKKQLQHRFDTTAFVALYLQSATRLLLLHKPKDPKAFLIEKLTELKAANRKVRFYLRRKSKFFKCISPTAAVKEKCQKTSQTRNSSGAIIDSIQLLSKQLI